jgi:hypothetical protein
MSLVRAVNLMDVLGVVDDDEGLQPATAYTVRVIACRALQTDLLPVYEVIEGPFTGKKVMAGVMSWNGNGARVFKAQLRALLGADYAAVEARNPTGEELAEMLVGRVTDLTIP